MTPSVHPRRCDRRNTPPSPVVTETSLAFSGPVALVSVRGTVQGRTVHRQSGVWPTMTVYCRAFPWYETPRRLVGNGPLNRALHRHTVNRNNLVRKTSGVFETAGAAFERLLNQDDSRRLHLPRVGGI